LKYVENSSCLFLNHLNGIITISFNAFKCKYVLLQSLHSCAKHKCRFFIIFPIKLQFLYGTLRRLKSQNPLWFVKYKTMHIGISFATYTISQFMKQKIYNLVHPLSKIHSFHKKLYIQGTSIFLNWKLWTSATWQHWLIVLVG